MTAPSASAGDLVLTTSDSVATMWLNRPDKRNAVTLDMWHRLADRCRELASDPDVRLLVVRGVGDHFCAGADIAGLGDVSPEDYRAANTAADDALARFPKPTIARGPTWVVDRIDPMSGPRTSSSLRGHAGRRDHKHGIGVVHRRGRLDGAARTIG